MGQAYLHLGDHVSAPRELPPRPPSKPEPGRRPGADRSIDEDHRRKVAQADRQERQQDRFPPRNRSRATLLILCEISALPSRTLARPPRRFSRLLNQRLPISVAMVHGRTDARRGALACGPRRGLLRPQDPVLVECRVGLELLEALLAAEEIHVFLPARPRIHEDLGSADPAPPGARHRCPTGPGRRNSDYRRRPSAHPARQKGRFVLRAKRPSGDFQGSTEGWSDRIVRSRLTGQYPSRARGGFAPIAPEPAGCPAGCIGGIA